MLDKQQLETLLRDAITLDELHLSLNDSHAEVIAVGEVFAGLSPVRRQQLVYQPLMQLIQEGTLHAVSIKAFTPQEWQRHQMLNGPAA